MNEAARGMKDSGDNDDGKDGSGNTGTGIVTKTRPKTKKPSSTRCCC